MNPKKIVLLVVVLLIGFTARVQAKEPSLSANVTRAVVQETENTYQAAFSEYQKGLAEIKEPSYTALRPLFEKLTVCNKMFATQKEQENWKQMAEMLAAPKKAGWNDYRPIGMVEIFDYYFPQENKDKEIALLEYNVKNNLLPQSQREFITVFDRLDDDEILAFQNAYEKFIDTLKNAKSYSEKKIVESFVPMIEAYNHMDQNSSGAAFLAKKSVFMQPFAAGWGRTTTVADLRYSLGMKEYSGGDYAEPYSPEELQQRYGVSIEAAGMFFQFVKNYHQQV